MGRSRIDARLDVLAYRQSEIPALLPDGGGRTSEHAPERSIHVALIAEPSLKRDRNEWLRGLPQEARRALDTQSRSGLLQTFSSCLPIR